MIAPLHKALREEDYSTPTPIQAQTIPDAIRGNDILGCAQTGTGKTAAFAIPILNRLGSRNRKALPNRPKSLILAPTRELAIQIGESMATYGKHLRIRQVLVYGGVSQGNQVRALNRGAHVLIATPGRLLDLMEQGFITLSDLEVFVLDEADRMLDMGFMPALKQIISKLPVERQSLFFSATMPPKISELAQQLLSDPVRVNVTPKSPSVKRIEQNIVFVDRKKKLPLLHDMLSSDEVQRAIVFTRTKRGANVLAEKLGRKQVRAVAIHGNKSQSARQKALEAFRKNRVKVLVATDVAARGIDIAGVSHVFNFDLPNEPENYVHRIGRTGRAGAEGIAISFCCAAEREELKAIEEFISMRIPLAPNQPECTDPVPVTQPKRPRRGSSAGRKRTRRTTGSPKASESGRNASITSSSTRNGDSATRKRRPSRRRSTQNTSTVG